MFYEFEVIGKITGKARPKVNTYTMRGLYTNSDKGLWSPNKTVLCY